MSKSERASKAETAFKLFDKNRDGFITREEFTQVRSPSQTWFSTSSKPQVSKKLSKDQIEAVFAKFDGNGDGKLSKEEFQQLMAAKK